LDWDSVIREEGGKMYLEERQWMLAYNEFFESFRNYQEAGQARATQCLKYVVLANMLASSDINPFDSREAKVYQDVDEIGAMLLLRSAYETNDIKQFEKVLQNPKYKLLSDPIMMKYLQPLLRNIRCQVMKSYVRPYRVMQMQSVAKAVNISLQEAEEIAVVLIQNGELHAKIDQTKGLLVMQDRQRYVWDCERLAWVDDGLTVSLPCGALVCASRRKRSRLSTDGRRRSTSSTCRSSLASRSRVNGGGKYQIPSQSFFCHVSNGKQTRPF
jgi:hypothetical protein